MPNKSESKIVCGNSYLCPLVTALYLSWKRDSLKNTSFNGFLSLLSKRNVFDKILYSNTSLINDTDLRKYPILYFSNDSNKDSINLKEFFERTWRVTSIQIIERIITSNGLYGKDNCLSWNDNRKH